MNFLNPRIISFCVSIVICFFTVVFLTFLEEVTSSTLVVAGVTSFFTSFFLILYTLEVIVFREVNRMYRSIQKLKMKDFSVQKKQIIKEGNPLKRLNDEIFVYAEKKQKEIDELKKAEQFRREFIADVSHELKTPIFAAQGFIHTLIDGAVDDIFIRDRFLHKAAKSLDGLSLLVQDLLTLSQMEAGTITMQKDSVDIRNICEDIQDRLEKIIADRKITIKIKPDHYKKVWVKGDAQRLDQVMLNLVSNAIKYNNEGGKVIIYFEETKKYVLVTVRDNGPGIAPEHITRIFERFYRVEKSRSKEKGGTGLGLAIVKHILNAHNAPITVHSQVGKGTKFTFKIEKALEKRTSPTP